MDPPSGPDQWPFRRLAASATVNAERQWGAQALRKDATMPTRTLDVAQAVVTHDLRRLHRHLLVIITVLLGLEAIALASGWDVLTRVNPDWPQIYPYTILGMLALVGAMALFRLQRTWATWTGRALAGLTLVLGLGVEFGVGLGILPSSDPTSESGVTWVTVLPSVAAVATAAAVLLITTSSTAAAWTRFGLLLFAGAVSTLIVLAYLYGSTELVTGLGLTGTSLPAALIGLLVLACAASARPDQPPLDRLDERYDTRLLRWIVPMLAIAPFVPAIVAAIVGRFVSDPASAAAVAELLAVVILVGVISVMGAAQSRARREVLMQRQRVWDAFAQAPAATAIVTLDGRIAAANQSLSRLTGRREDDLVGSLVPDLIADADHVRVSEAVAEVAAGRDSVRRDVRFRGTGRDTTWVDLTLAAVRDSSEQVIYLILQGSDLSDRKQLERVLSEQSQRDPLTGLLNRSGLDEQVEMLWRARAPRERVIVIVADIDDLRTVNETHGLAAGDDLLREVARRLRTSTRSDDVIARVGGDEFVVVTSTATGSPASVDALLARMRSALSGPVAVGREVVPLSVTVGHTTLSDLSEAVGALDSATSLGDPHRGPRRRASDSLDRGVGGPPP